MHQIVAWSLLILCGRRVSPQLRLNRWLAVADGEVTSVDAILRREKIDRAKSTSFVRAHLRANTTYHQSRNISALHLQMISKVAAKRGAHGLRLKIVKLEY